MRLRQAVSTVRISCISWISCFSLAIPALLAAQATTDQHLASQVDSIATAVLAETGVPSASVAVVRHGRVVYANAYGSAKLEPAVKATPDMLYGIGSISKQLTAATILLLQQDGKLSLDDHVSKFIPGLTRGDEITIRELLSHTSGYQDFWPQDYVPPLMQKPISPQGILDHWAKQPLDFDPGTRWQYSNTNFVIAAQIVQKVSGQPFWTFLKARVLDPVGLAHAIDLDTQHGQLEPTGYFRHALGPLRPALMEAPGWYFADGEMAMPVTVLTAWAMGETGDLSATAGAGTEAVVAARTETAATAAKPSSRQTREMRFMHRDD